MTDTTQPRKIVGYGDCKCVLSKYCDGLCNPIWADKQATTQTEAESHKAALVASAVAFASANQHAVPETPLWRCFHCEESFTDREKAALHFGYSERQAPACKLDEKHLREIEAELERYREEDTELHREIAGQQARLEAAKRRAEEEGYARGLRDAHLLDPVAAPEVPTNATPAPWEVWESRTVIHATEGQVCVCESADDAALIVSLRNASTGAAPVTPAATTARYWPVPSPVFHAVKAAIERLGTTESAFCEMGSECLCKSPTTPCIYRRDGAPASAGGCARCCGERWIIDPHDVEQGQIRCPDCADPATVEQSASVDVSQACRNVMLRVGYSAVPRSCPRCGLAKECPMGHAQRADSERNA